MHDLRAKLFTNGGSQAVRLPRQCRFEGISEVAARREGRRVILEPIETWSPAFLKILGAWSEDIPRPRSPRIDQMPVRGTRRA